MIRILESALNPSKAQAEGIDPHELLNYAVEAYLK